MLFTSPGVAVVKHPKSAVIGNAMNGWMPTACAHLHKHPNWKRTVKRSSRRKQVTECAPVHKSVQYPPSASATVCLDTRHSVSVNCSHNGRQGAKALPRLAEQPEPPQRNSGDGRLSRG